MSFGQRTGRSIVLLLGFKGYFLSFNLALVVVGIELGIAVIAMPLGSDDNASYYLSFNEPVDFIYNMYKKYLCLCIYIYDDRSNCPPPILVQNISTPDKIL